MKRTLLLTFAVLLFHSTWAIDKRDYSKRSYYTVHTLKPNDRISADLIAHEMGGQIEGQVGELSQYYWMSISKDSKDVLQHYKKLKRSFDSMVVDVQPQIPKRLHKRAPPPVIENKNDEYRLNGETIPLPSLDDPNGFQLVKDALSIKDPGFDRQWHLINREERGHDVNVTGVWSQGITGKNVVVAILDDGLEMNHPDLQDNYFAKGSYDFNDHTDEPRPRLNDDTHGTRCAGEIAAVKNDVCGIGVAYDAKVAGIRILSGDITEADEAAALNYAYQENSIYSCSWGPADSGEVAEAPQGIILDAIKNGIYKGRNGTGSIFVFASGNGGTHDDNCNFDGYTNSLYTITVGAIDKQGNHPYYSEKCAAQLVVTYSSGSGGYIYTTDVGDTSCSDRHGGTSAAAPLAAGVFALVLSVRPDLTWRDLQHLCVQSAVPISLHDDDWSKLPSGRMFNHKFGYGVLDAYRIVELAKKFETVRAQTSLEVLSIINPDNEKQDIPDLTPATSFNGTIEKEKAFTTSLSVTKDMLDDVGLGRLEHVTATVNIEHERRGDLEILLESPHGIVSQLGSPRQFDKSTEGLKDWTFMTVKHWEEDPVGEWTLRIVDGKHPENTGKFIDWKLTLWGELLEGYEPKPMQNDQESDGPNIGVDDFESDQDDQQKNQLFLDQQEEPKPNKAYVVYGIVSLFMIASIASTAFIVKKYMLSTAQLNYSKPTEEDAFEFDNLLNDESNNDDDDSIEGFQVDKSNNARRVA
ncbi:peptidase S8/S53 domain-containing protein [Parasitella parasitica]|nr:peptidase S8/S53 domain-containing protein [Parasitella parasitica]